MKLSLEALKERAEAVASEELMGSISGGLLNACHNSVPLPTPTKDTTPTIGNDGTLYLPRG